ncbi:hypothetical protein Tco_0859701 [Tanacetum coccineum]|uniref:FHA domain-containing protein n=1 Tax=Tanacetum coccineum TaxID=301880 RepID=A0ABQ5BGR2_9ASTR
MASFDYRLNPLYTIKECSSCGALYTTDYCCSKGGPVDKIVRDPNKTPDSSQRPPQNCARCGNPVDGPYCQGSALLRKKFKEDLFTYCVKNGIFQDLQDTFESSNDNTNVVNAPQEPFVVKQDPGLASLVGKRCSLWLYCSPHIPIIFKSGNHAKSKTIVSSHKLCHVSIRHAILEIEIHSLMIPSNFRHDSLTFFTTSTTLITLPYSWSYVGTIAIHGYDCPPQVVCLQSGPGDVPLSDDDDDEESSIPLRDIIISRLPPRIVIKTSVEILCPNPHQSEGFSDSNDDSTSIDDDSFSVDDINYVEASPPDSELVSLEEVKDFYTEDGEIKDSPSTFPNSFLEETNTFDNSFTRSKTFRFNLEEISSDSTTTRSNYSFPDYEAFYLDNDHIEEKSSGSTTTHADFS